MTRPQLPFAAAVALAAILSLGALHFPNHTPTAPPPSHRSCQERAERRRRARDRARNPRRRS